MNIFLTGGAGFIGSHLAKRLLLDGHYVVNIDNFDLFYDRALKEKNVAILKDFNKFRNIEGDIRDSDLIENTFKSGQFDLVIHLAAKAGVRPSITDPAVYFDVNVNGTINILEQMKQHKTNKLMIASSSSVYGNNSKVPFSEIDSVDNPISPYAASKKACELLCSTYHSLYNIDIFAYRFFTVYGPAQRPEMAIAKFTSAILKDEIVTLFDQAGETSRDYTYIDDIVDGLIKSIDKVKGFEIFNFGGSSPLKLIDLIKIIEKELNKSANLKFGDNQPGDVRTTFADISKAKRMLDYNPVIKIEEGISKYCDWIKRNK